MMRPFQRPAQSTVAIALGLITLMGLWTLRGAFAPSRTLGIPPLVPPFDNSATPQKLALGRKLFFDKRLSSNNTISCATCHDPNYGFADPHAVSVGVKGRVGERNSHTLLNVAFMTPLMWDGRAETLEEQALLVFLSPSEFDLAPDQAALTDDCIIRRNMGEGKSVLSM